MNWYTYVCRHAATPQHQPPKLNLRGSTNLRWIEETRLNEEPGFLSLGLTVHLIFLLSRMSVKQAHNSFPVLLIYSIYDRLPPLHLSGLWNYMYV